MIPTRIVQSQNSEMKRQCGFEMKQECEFSSVELIGMVYRQVGFMGIMERAEKQKKVICKCFWKQII